MEQGGARVAKTPDTPNNQKRTALIVCGVLAVLAAAYLLLCFWVGRQNTIFPNTWVAGVDVSGMTQTEAVEALNTWEEGPAGALTLELVCGDWTDKVTARDMDYDWNKLVDFAYRTGRESFFGQGLNYLKSLMGAQNAVSLDAGFQGGPALDALLDRCAEQVGQGRAEPQFRVEGDKLLVTKGTAGLRLDREMAQSDVRWALGELFGQQEQTTARVELTLVEDPCPELDEDAVYRQFHAEAKDAALDPETFKVSDHVVGVDFDKDQLKAQYAKAGEGSEIAIPLTLTQPKETKKSLEGKLFKDVLGQATSRVKGTANRKSNVKRAAAACNGVVILPGQVFSYNNSVGRITTDRGYLMAPVYSAGQSVDGVGGGICQPSSTLYSAVLRTTLEVVERRNHMFAVGYVPDGMDATVYYGSTDFRFKNNTNYPIRVVTESYDKGGARYLTVKLLGTNETGRYAVPTNHVFDWEEPTTKYVADPNIPRGTTKEDKEQNPYKGRKATVTRTVYEANGTVVEKQKMGTSTYKMRPRTVYYNPLDGDPATWVNGVPPKPAPVEPPKPPVSPVEPPAPPVEPSKPPVSPVEPPVVGPGNPVTPPTAPEVPGDGGGSANPAA